MESVCSHMHIINVIKIAFLNWSLICYSLSFCAGVQCKHINKKQLANKHSFIRGVCQSQWRPNTSGRQIQQWENN